MANGGAGDAEEGGVRYLEALGRPDQEQSTPNRREAKKGAAQPKKGRGMQPAGRRGRQKQ